MKLKIKFWDSPPPPPHVSKKLKFQIILYTNLKETLKNPYPVDFIPKV